MTEHTMWVPVSEETAADLGWWPWRRPNPNPMPELVLFPRLARALRRWARRH